MDTLLETASNRLKTMETVDSGLNTEMDEELAQLANDIRDKYSPNIKRKALPYLIFLSRILLISFRDIFLRRKHSSRKKVDSHIHTIVAMQYKELRKK